MAPLRVADLEVDALRRRIRQGEREIPLTPAQHILLYILAARVGEVISYREIAGAMGKTEPEIRNNTLARHVSGLRRKLRDDADRPRYIETVPGIGYRLRARVPGRTGRLASSSSWTGLSRPWLVER